MLTNCRPEAFEESCDSTEIRKFQQKKSLEAAKEEALKVPIPEVGK